MKLLELVYEGGLVLDLCLSAQRDLLRDSLGKEFFSFDLRLPVKERRAALAALSKYGTSNLLIRGLSGVQEASQVFVRAGLFLDVLGKSEIPAPRSLAPFAYRVRRVFSYSPEMSQALRGAGVGVITQLSGPYFPSVPCPSQNMVGVVGLYRGAFEVTRRLVRERDEMSLDFEVISTEEAPGALREVDPVKVAQCSTLLISPYEQVDQLGPHEGAILAASTGRPICTTDTSAMGLFPAFSRENYLRVRRYDVPSYVSRAVEYIQGKSTVRVRFGPTPSNDVPREVLERLQ